MTGVQTVLFRSEMIKNMMNNNALKDQFGGKLDTKQLKRVSQEFEKFMEKDKSKSVKNYKNKNEESDNNDNLEKMDKICEKIMFYIFIINN